MATLVSITLMLVLVNFSGVEATWEEHMEIEKQLKILNKEPVKSIQVESGDIFDCIHIYKQPAFDHPLLKNHTIQMEPTFSLQNKLKEIVWKEKNHKHEVCPKGTVAIRRTLRKDLVRAKRLMEQHSTNIHPLGAGPGNSRALLGFSFTKTKITGVDGLMNVMNPKVEKDQFSSSLIFVEKGTIESGEYSGVQAGWTVSPGLYGDSKTRLTTHWETYNGGKLEGACYNDLCPGFVHVPNAPPLDLVLSEVSEYDGNSYGISVSIVQDNTTKHWWLTSDDQKFGYWPDFIIPHLRDGAGRVAWGGTTHTSSDGISPPMAFGQFPDGNFTHCGYFKNLHVFDEGGNHIVPLLNHTDIVVDSKHCYKLEFPSYSGEPDGYTFSYGGPGGKCLGGTN